jgi:hypothetical protein
MALHPTADAKARIARSVKNWYRALWARDLVPLRTPDFRPGLNYAAPSELEGGIPSFPIYLDAAACSSGVVTEATEARVTSMRKLSGGTRS